MYQLKVFLHNYLKNNILKYFMLLLIFSLGILGGSIAINILPENEKSNLSEYLNIFFKANDELLAVGNISLLLKVWWLNAKVVLLIWLLGFTIIGVPGVLFILFTRGFVIGFTVGFLVQSYSLQGLAVAAASVLPHNLLMVPIYLSVSCAAISFSLYLVKKRNAASQKLASAAANYSFLCLLLAFLTVFCAMVEVYIAPLLTCWLLWLF